MDIDWLKWLPNHKTSVMVPSLLILVTNIQFFGYSTSQKILLSNIAKHSSSFRGLVLTDETTSMSETEQNSTSCPPHQRVHAG